MVNSPRKKKRISFISEGWVLKNNISAGSLQVSFTAQAWTGIQMASYPPLRTPGNKLGTSQHCSVLGLLLTSEKGDRA